jgi:hypothetical protein
MSSHMILSIIINALLFIRTSFHDWLSLLLSLDTNNCQTSRRKHMNVIPNSFSPTPTPLPPTRPYHGKMESVSLSHMILKFIAGIL